MPSESPRQRIVSIEQAHPHTEDVLLIRGEPFAHPGAKMELQRELTPFEARCGEVGEEVEEVAIGMGLSTRKHILVDDVDWAEKQAKSQDSWRWQLFRERAKLGAEVAYGAEGAQSEADLVAKAHQLLSTRPAGEGGSMRLKTATGEQDVKLRGFKGVSDKEHPSCDILDVVWHEKKADEADILITVLHKKYRNQQARVHALARELAVPNLEGSSSATLFLDDDGKPELFTVWKVQDEVADRFFKTVASKYALPEQGS